MKILDLVFAIGSITTMIVLPFTKEVIEGIITGVVIGVYVGWRLWK